MTSPPREPYQIIVLAQSKSWASIIRRHFADVRLSWVLDLDGLENEIAQNQAVAAIIEIPIKNLDKTCIRLSRLDNNSNNVNLFAVGDQELQQWHSLLRAAGISAWFWSPLHAPQLAEVIVRQCLASPPKTVSLESGFESRLPWATAAEDGFE